MWSLELREIAWRLLVVLVFVLVGAPLPQRAAKVTSWARETCGRRTKD